MKLKKAVVLISYKYISFLSKINIWRQAEEANKIMKSLYLEMGNDPKNQIESMSILCV